MEGRRKARDETRVTRDAETRTAATVDVDVPEERGPAAYVAEFIGTLALVFFITMAVVQFLPVELPTPEPDPNQLTPPPEPETPFQDWAVVGLVHVFILFVLIQTLAVISGAHFNPVVTLALAAIRQIRPIDAAIYIVVQLAGGVLGALLTKSILSDEGDPVHHGAVDLTARIEEDFFPAGFALEAIGTFFLVWAIVGVAVNPRATRDWAALTIGAILGVGVMTIGALTGAGFNPARAFGPAIVSDFFGGEGGLEWIVAYVLGPAVGALLAAGIYFYMYILPGRKGTGGMGPVG